MSHEVSPRVSRIGPQLHWHTISHVLNEIRDSQWQLDEQHHKLDPDDVAYVENRAAWRALMDLRMSLLEQYEAQAAAAGLPQTVPGQEVS